MKTIAIACVLILCFSTCKKDETALLVQRWRFVAIDMPGVKTFLRETGAAGDGDAITFQKFFLDNKLVLRKDSSFDLVLMKQYIHGKWKFDADRKELLLEDASYNKLNMQFSTDTVEPYQLHLATDEFAIDKIIKRHIDDKNGFNYLQHKQYYQFFLEAEDERFADAADDLYSKENNLWRIKPNHSETAAEIKERVLNHLQFWELLFHDAAEHERDYVSYNWFSSPIVIATNGTILQFYEEAKSEWDQNFYDSVQAKAGYDLLIKCFSQKIKYLQHTGKYERNEDIVKQLRSNLINATKNQQKL
ncbi:hypothetical protein [Limnovirga soli]|uniref:Uncharacterized protein n=1 Tax=Limnovirga soli TaxID=2656915 RepID=A0A8J8JV24_9BACT|nr:hypothetical protein [Limnovirga soli]NNV56179.1 hypothetical protein [Limnovirga soli]